MSLAGRGVVVAGPAAPARVLAVAAATRGAQVVVSLPAGSEEAIARLLSETGGRAHGVVADPAVEADAERLFAVATARLSRIDAVVCALPELPALPLLELTLPEWEEGVARTLRSAFLVSRLAIEEFLAHGAQGRLVHLVSAPRPGIAGQAAAAAGLESLLSLTRSTAKEYGPRGICCNAAVSWGAPGHAVVEAVLFLASADASYVNGEAVRVGP